jgi:tRNA 2-thiouridine synthesizing protein E
MTEDQTEGQAELELSRLARDNEGFLLHPADWSQAVACAIARESGQQLGERHWQVITYIRDYYERTETVPEARKLLRFMRDSWGDELGTRKTLYGLFPTGYGQTACKIAGMRKPLKLMLDV